MTHIYFVTLDETEAVFRCVEAAKQWITRREPDLTITKIASWAWGCYQPGRFTPVGRIRRMRVRDYKGGA